MTSIATKTPLAAAQRVPSIEGERAQKGPLHNHTPSPQVQAGSGGVLGPGFSGGGNPPDDHGLPGSQGRPQRPPGLPLQLGGDSGGDSGGDDGDEPQDTDQDLYGKQHRKPLDDPDSSGATMGAEDVERDTRVLQVGSSSQSTSSEGE